MPLIARLRELFHLARGGAVEFDLAPYRKLLGKIDEHDFEGADDEQLKQKSAELAARARDGVDLDRLLPEAFALVRETSQQHSSETQGLFIHFGVNHLHEAAGTRRTDNATLGLYRRRLLAIVAMAPRLARSRGNNASTPADAKRPDVRSHAEAWE